MTAVVPAARQPSSRAVGWRVASDFLPPPPRVCPVHPLARCRASEAESSAESGRPGTAEAGHACWGEPRRDCVSCSHSRLEVPRQVERGQAARRDLESSPTPHSSQLTSISDLPLCRRPQGAPTPASSSPQVRDRCQLGAVPRAPVASASASSTRRGARATASSRAGDARPAFWHPIARTPASRALPRRRASFWRHPCEMRRRVAAPHADHLGHLERARCLRARQRSSLVVAATSRDDAVARGAWPAALL